jgi:hypothetical protein
MKIIDLNEEYKQSYCHCLEDWSKDMQDAGNHKEVWYNKMKEKGLRVKLAINDENKPVGMIQYIPIEYSQAEGKDLYFICCIWVHGHKKGVGNNQKKGNGKALLQAAEKDAKELGKKGIVAWGITLPFFMRASWFKKQGYQKIDKEDGLVLLWKPFTQDAIPPKWIRKVKKPAGVKGKVTISGFISGWCPAMNMTFERVKRAIKETGDKADLVIFDTLNRDIMLEWGILDAIYIDDKELRTGPPPSFEKIKRKISKKIKKL